MPETDTETDGTERDPHVPTPIERGRSDGSLRVVEHSNLRRSCPRQIVVSAEDRALYAVLSDVLADVHIPDLFPAALATAATDTADALDRVTSIDRGFIDPPLPGASYALSYAKNAADALREHRDRDPLRLALMGCSGSKHDVDGPVPARDLYASGYWTVKERYGDAADDWRVLSAEHAVLSPDAEFAYYERTPSDLRGIPVDSDARLPSGDSVRDRLDHWALRVYNGLTRWLRDVSDGSDPRDVQLEVCVGEKYRDPLEARGVFERLRTSAGLSVSFPFQEEPEAAGGMGPQMEWMNSEVAAADGGRSVDPETDHGGAD
jgi:hypothetical protein